jgi:hypothetical protein
MEGGMFDYPGKIKYLTFPDSPGFSGSSMDL